MFSFKFWAATAALVTMASAAQAAPMVYTFEVNASGQLNGQSFTNAAVTVTLTGESSVPYAPCGYCYLVLADTTLIEVAGVGSDSFLNPITAVSSAFVDYHDDPSGVNVGYLGFGEPVSDYGIFFIEYDYLLALNYDLTPLGPVSGEASGNPGIAFDTLGGSFTFDSFAPDGTFVAVSAPVPEPGTWLLLLGGVAALVQRRMAVMAAASQRMGAKRFMAAA